MKDIISYGIELINKARKKQKDSKIYVWAPLSAFMAFQFNNGSRVGIIPNNLNDLPYQITSDEISRRINYVKKNYTEVIVD